MKQYACLLPLLFLACSCSQARLQHRRDAQPLHHGIASATTSISIDSKTPPTTVSESSSRNTATVPTPITTALPTSAIPLYIPQLDPNEQEHDIKVQYLGPANGGSTVYQVVMQDQQSDLSMTATLIEDASNAKVLGGQDKITVDGTETTVAAAASCGFQDGLNASKKDSSAGLCSYWHVVGHATSTWTSGVTQISAETSITATTDPAQSTMPQTSQDDAEWSNSTPASAVLPSALTLLSLFTLALIL